MERQALDPSIVAGPVESVKTARAPSPEATTILSEEALEFVASLVRAFRPAVRAVLESRASRQQAIDKGMRPHFAEATRKIRESEWKVAPVPADLEDRRVEITGPVERKMIINALNSGANVFMADFEDSNAPTWANVIEGQVNLRDAIDGSIQFVNPKNGKRYQLNDEVATLMVRPRGLHLVEQHVWVDAEAIPAALLDFGLFFFHNAERLIEKGSGPYFYLPKLESQLEALLWNDIFVHAQEALGIPVGTIKATVLLETLPAAFEMHEILYALRDHSAGLNCGRWDYVFSFIKTLKANPDCLLPDRSQVGMTQHCMRSYTRLVVQTCHRRGVHAMGGMAAQIPIKRDPVANEIALEKVRQDKLREVNDGHDGTWVAHPGLVAIAKEIFDTRMPAANQLDRIPEDVITAEDLLTVPTGTRTESGLRHNLRVGVQYLAAWLRGQGCVPLYDLMEDAATAEISRAQLWQWVAHGAKLEDGRTVTAELINQTLHSELVRLDPEGHDSALNEAAQLFRRLTIAPTLAPFLTVPAYDRLVSNTTLSPLG